MNLPKAIALCIYLLGPHAFFFYVGLMWFAIAHKWKIRPKNIVTVGFGLNFMLLGYGLKLPFLIILLISATMLGCIWVGFKC